MAETAIVLFILLVDESVHELKITKKVTRISGHLDVPCHMASRAQHVPATIDPPSTARLNEDETTIPTTTISNNISTS